MLFFKDFRGDFFLRLVLSRIPAIFFALGLHEWIHAFTAVKLGDETAKKIGRYTANPFKHIDPVGMVIFFLYGFGWSRPIPINPVSLKSRTKDIIIISLSGPVFSLGIALIAGFIFYGFGFYKYSFFFNQSADRANFLVMYLADLLGFFMEINFVIFIFNFIPVNPLDGSKIWMILLSPKNMEKEIKFQVYGILGLIAFIILGGANFLVKPVIDIFRTTIDILSKSF